MARNLIQLVFLLYAGLLILASRRVIGSLIKRKIGATAFRRGQRGFGNALLYLRLQSSLSPVIFWMNVMNVTTFFLCLVLQLTVGWFSFAATGMKIFHCATLLIAALQAYPLSVAAMTMRFGQSFVLYRADDDPNTVRAFASSLWDALVYGVIPVGLAISNFFAF